MLTKDTSREWRERENIEKKKEKQRNFIYVHTITNTILRKNKKGLMKKAPLSKYVERFN